MSVAVDKLRAALKGEHATDFAKYRGAAGVVPFAHEVLAVTPSQIQCSLLVAMVTCARLAVACGQRTGRTMAFAIRFLHHICTEVNARAILSTPSHSHMRTTIWKQIGDLIRGAKVSLGATWHELPHHGVHIANGNEGLGIASDVGERLQGHASPNIIILGDEFAGYPPNLVTPLMSNLAGGGSVCIGGNPTNNDSFFATRWKTPGWTTLNLSALDVASSPDRQPGQATPEWCEEMLNEHGADSLLYRARVLGQFSAQNANGVFSLAELEDAQGRFDSNVGAFEKAGPLCLGVDVARTGLDSSVCIARRGHVALAPLVWKIPDLMAVADEVLQYARKLRSSGEVVTIRIDGVGVGAGVVDALKRAPDIRVVDVQASGSPSRDAYTNVRSESVFVCRDWLRAGGCIARDSRLEGEMAALQYTFDARNKLKILPKDELRKLLGRSTDRFDALALATYERGEPVASFGEAKFRAAKRTF
jgi:phage terminase large subunit